MEIINYLKISDKLQLSGQPNEDEFAFIASTGVNTIINLAMPDSKGALNNEGELVTQNAMNYIHIPVVWDKPLNEQFNFFSTILEQQPSQQVLVHCALGWRASCFAYLYRTKILGTSKEEARKTLESIWTPNEIWTKYIDENA